jgi:hypothetical protein
MPLLGITVLLIAAHATAADAQLDNFCASAGSPSLCTSLPSNLCMWCGGSPLNGGRCVPQLATSVCPPCSNYTSYDVCVNNAVDGSGTPCNWCNGATNEGPYCVPPEPVGGNWDLCPLCSSYTSASACTAAIDRFGGFPCTWCSTASLSGPYCTSAVDPNPNCVEHCHAMTTPLACTDAALCTWCAADGKCVIQGSNQSSCARCDTALTAADCPSSTCNWLFDPATKRQYCSSAVVPFEVLATQCNVAVGDFCVAFGCGWCGGNLSQGPYCIPAGDPSAAWNESCPPCSTARDFQSCSESYNSYGTMCA